MTGKFMVSVIYTLDEIEHKILRPMGEPRIHMAILRLAFLPGLALRTLYGHKTRISVG